MLPALTNSSGVAGTRKPFYKTPQGIVGALLLVGALTVFGIYVAPLLLTALTNLVVFGSVLMGTLLVGSALYTNRVRLWYGYMSFTRKLINTVVKIEPIDVMKIYIGNLRQRIRDMEKQIVGLEGVVEYLKGEFAENGKQIVELKDEYDVAMEQKDTGSAQVKMNQIGRLTQDNEEYRPLIMQLQGYIVKLDKMKDGAGLMIEDMENDIKQKEKKYEAIKKTYSAIKSAQAIFEGNPDERALFEEALETMKTDMSNRIAAFDRIMRQNDTVIKNIDIQKGVATKRGLRVIEELNNNSIDYLLKPLATNPNEIPAIPSADGVKQPLIATPANADNKYLKYLQK